jgi:hypothetical protein
MNCAYAYVYVYTMHGTYVQCTCAAVYVLSMFRSSRVVGRASLQFKVTSSFMTAGPDSEWISLDSRTPEAPFRLRSSTYIDVLSLNAA